MARARSSAERLGARHFPPPAKRIIPGARSRYVGHGAGARPGRFQSANSWRRDVLGRVAGRRPRAKLETVGKKDSGKSVRRRLNLFRRFVLARLPFLVKLGIGFSQ